MGSTSLCGRVYVLWRHLHFEWRTWGEHPHGWQTSGESDPWVKPLTTTLVSSSCVVVSPPCRHSRPQRLWMMGCKARQEQITPSKGSCITVRLRLSLLLTFCPQPNKRSGTAIRSAGCFLWERTRVLCESSTSLPVLLAGNLATPTYSCYRSSLATTTATNKKQPAIALEIVVCSHQQFLGVLCTSSQRTSHFATFWWKKMFYINDSRNEIAPSVL